MALRVVIVTTLLICAFAIELLLHPSDTLRPLFMLAAAAYGMVLGGGNRKLASQCAGEVGVVTLILLAYRMLKMPIEFFIPALTYWYLNKKGGTETVRDMIAKAPALVTKIATMGITKQHVKATAAALKAMLISSPKSPK